MISSASLLGFKGKRPASKSAFRASRRSCRAMGSLRGLALARQNWFICHETGIRQIWTTYIRTTNERPTAGIGGFHPCRRERQLLARGSRAETLAALGLAHHRRIGDTPRREAVAAHHAPDCRHRRRRAVSRTRP